MNSSIKKKDEFQIEVSVDLDKKDLEGYIAEAEKQIAGSVKLDGFRQGKVPPEVLRKNIDPSAIKQEALELAVQGSLGDVIGREKLEVIDQEKLKITENSADALKYTVALTVMPELELKDYTGHEIKGRKVEVKSEEAEKVIADLLKAKTRYHEENRPAKKGDRIEIDFVVKHNEEVIEGGRSENHPFILGENIFAPGFEDHVIGMSLKEQKSFSLNIPSDYYQKTIAGKKIDVDVTVKKIERREVPELTDEYAKTLGNFQTVNDLRSSIREGLNMEAQQKEQSRVRIELLDKILNKNVFDVPPVLIKNQVETMVQNFDADLHARGMELGPYLAHVKKTQDELQKDFEPQAIRQVKMDLVLRAVAKKEDIQVKDSEIQEQFEQLMQQVAARGMSETALKEMDVQRTRTRIYATLLNEKVFDFLLKKNTLISET